MLNDPPSVTITLPLTNAPACEVRYKIAPAISSIDPSRCNGINALGNTPSGAKFGIIFFSVVSEGYTFFISKFSVPHSV